MGGMLTWNHMLCLKMKPFLQIFTPILHWTELDVAGPPPHPYPYGSRGPPDLDLFMWRYGYRPQVD